MAKREMKDGDESESNNIRRGSERYGDTSPVRHPPDDNQFPRNFLYPPQGASFLDEITNWQRCPLMDEPVYNDTISPDK